jgi:hypothetical protein
VVVDLIVALQLMVWSVRPSQSEFSEVKFIVTSTSTLASRILCSQEVAILFKALSSAGTLHYA